mgnify:CR=1 FL=1
MCGNGVQTCPKVPNSARDHNECYNPDPEAIACLNRMDQKSELFAQSLYKEEALNLNKHPFDFNKMHLRCQENNWIPWNGLGLDELVYTKTCQSNSGKQVGGQVLLELLLRDMGFKGRDLIPEDYLKK